jgi:hypothetical protein
VDRDSPARRIFSLAEAQRLLPEVKRLTEAASTQVDALLARIDALAEDDPARVELAREAERAIEAWAVRLGELGLEAKGLWLVDFDNGEGYYCWKYPEPAVAHYHAYEDGFAGRMKIT